MKNSWNVQVSMFNIQVKELFSAFFCTHACVVKQIFKEKFEYINTENSRVLKKDSLISYL